MTAVAPDRSARERAASFCRRFGLRVPILQAPMAGACPVGLAAWAGQAAAMARPEPAGEVVRRLWEEAEALLPGI